MNEWGNKQMGGNYEWMRERKNEWMNNRKIKLINKWMNDWENKQMK